MHKQKKVSVDLFGKGTRILTAAKSINGQSSGTKDGKLHNPVQSCHYWSILMGLALFRLFAQDSSESGVHFSGAFLQ